ncbi:MAG TPA: aspartate-semialdehyde dehydrogenase [Phycisphaerales bacterium]|nr:aspartate-semialdehyde dehydrogenase [Phycisphaerales bacterium]
MSLDRFQRLAIVGATGAVGREALRILHERGVSSSRIVALASGRSDGARLPYADRSIMVAPTTASAIESCDAALFCADADTARALAPGAARAGVLVVDNSSAFRLDPSVPLVIPEVNPHTLDASTPPRLVANPNCSTVILLTAIEPIRRAFGVSSIIVSTYQAVSGAGLAAIDELRAQTRAALEGAPLPPLIFPESCAFNLFPHESPVEPDTGMNAEERKVVAEARRILNDPGLSITPTCVRVPVERAHSQSITLELDAPATAEQVRALLRAAPGVEFLEPPDRPPTPLRAAGRDPVLVGRVRIDPDSGGRRLSLWVCADQLRKGAALNAVQILEALGTPPGCALRATRAGDAVISSPPFSGAIPAHHDHARA